MADSAALGPYVESRRRVQGRPVWRPRSRSKPGNGASSNTYSHPWCKPWPRQRPLKRAPELLKEIQCTHKNKRLRLFFQDEARIGQKGRVCHVWWTRGQRPAGLCDRRFTFAYIFAAVEPGTDNAFALVMPYADTAAMQVFLNAFSETIAPDEHAVMILDQAGCHALGSLRPTRPS